MSEWEHKHSSIRQSKFCNDEAGHEKKPLRYIEIIAQKPRLSFALWNGWCLFFLLLAIMGHLTSPVNFDAINVPFYVKGSIAYLREDALREAKLVATAMPTNLGNFQANISSPREAAGEKLTIIYEAPGNENIWELRYLKEIAQLEEKIISASGTSQDKVQRSYSQYCRMTYHSETGGSCRLPSSPIAFLVDKWMPIPYKHRPPHAVWASPRANYSACKLPSADEAAKKETYYTDSLKLISQITPKGKDPNEVLKLVWARKVCETQAMIMPHITCDEFKPCWCLLYNMASINNWTRTTNEMWDYSKIETYYNQNYQAFLDYWSVYGSDTNDFTSSEEFDLTERPWVPFVTGKVRAEKANEHRQMYPVEVPNLIRYVADASFGYPKKGRTGRALMSQFNFGLPRTNINTAWNGVQEDENSAAYSDLSGWTYKALHKLLYDLSKTKPQGMTIVFDCLPMYSSYISLSVVPSDMVFLACAMVFVFFYIVCMKRSFFIAFAAFAMIFLNMIPTLAIYLVILRQTYIGMLQLLSLFIIMGIGADNVFVLLDCYEADRHFSRPLDVDLSAAWRHAAKAMACTSLTTFFSFASNANSPFPAIQTFGMWCCCLILMNFVGVNTFFLSAISVYDFYFARKKICNLGDLATAEESAAAEEKTQREEEGEQQGFNTVQALPSAAHKGSAAAEGEQQDSNTVHEFPSGPPRFFATKFHSFINKAKIPLMLLWVGLTIMYFVFAMNLQPDPDVPKLLPKQDPYGQYTKALIEHFGALNNPYRIKVEIILGIHKDDPIDRKGTDPVKENDRGKVNWVNLQVENKIKDLQVWIIRLCDDLTAKSGRWVDSEGLQIASKQEVGGRNPIDCPWQDLKNWTHGTTWGWPQTTSKGLVEMLAHYFAQPQPGDPGSINFFKWQDNLFWTPEKLEFPSLMRLEVQLNVQGTMTYKDGLDLEKRWSSYIEKWRNQAPAEYRDGFYFTDEKFFHYFHIQERITSECYTGICLSLFLAYMVLIFATSNIIVATAAISCIASIVCSVMAFIYWMGWKLGMLEAVILVMVIGMSVDYVVHMSDAYLESIHLDRFNRTRFMLGKMGMSVLSGAVTTLGASACMTPAYITFFTKFGWVILFTIAQSLVTALFFFSAQMALFGPEHTVGDIPFAMMARKTRSFVLDRCGCSPKSASTTESPEQPTTIGRYSENDNVPMRQSMVESVSSDNSMPGFKPSMAVLDTGLHSTIRVESHGTDNSIPGFKPSMAVLDTGLHSTIRVESHGTRTSSLHSSIQVESDRTHTSIGAMLPIPKRHHGSVPSEKE